MKSFIVNTLLFTISCMFLIVVFAFALDYIQEQFVIGFMLGAIWGIFIIWTTFAVHSRVL